MPETVDLFTGSPAPAAKERESGRSAARPAHLLWEQGTGGSNPLAPTTPHTVKKTRHRDILEHLADGGRLTFGMKVTGALTKPNSLEVVPGPAIQNKTRFEMESAGWIEPVAPLGEPSSLRQYAITAAGRDALGVALAGPGPRRPVTDEERALIRTLRRCTFMPGSWDKRFVTDLQTTNLLTERMAACLTKVAHRYRGQLAKLK